MAVYNTSRYAGGLILPVRDTRNGRTKERPYLYTQRHISRDDVTIVQVYKTQEGDRLDILAHRFGGDSSLWWLLADVNKFFGFPLHMQPGTPLLIPSRADFQRVGGA